MKIKAHLDANGALRHHTTLYLPDSATNEEIEEAVNTWAQSYIDTWWERDDNDEQS